MSTPQRTHARVNLVVDRATADVLRIEAKKIYVFNHELFEDLLDYIPAAQRALALRFRDTTDLLEALGWDPNEVDDAETFEVPLTGDLVEQLLQRRYDLALTNKDRLDGLPTTEPIPPDILAEVTTDRLAAQTLHGLIGRYVRTITA